MARSGDLIASLVFFAIIHIPCIINFKLENDQFLTPEEISDHIEAFQFEDRKYVIYHLDVTFDEADIICQQKGRGGALAMPFHLDIAEFIAIALSETGIEAEDFWIGAKNTSEQFLWNNGFPVEESLMRALLLNRDGERHPEGVDRLCLAMAREQHEFPQFVDLECRLKRPFICEQELTDEGSPVPQPPISVGYKEYVIYYAHVNWNQAIAYCREYDMRLATFEDSAETNLVGRRLLKSRPSLEMAWIGGRYETSAWVFLPTHKVIPAETRFPAIFPPWIGNRTDKVFGCLLLDRHMANHPVFWPARCERKRSFICEREAQQHGPSVAEINGVGFALFYENKTWTAARSFCINHGMKLAEPSTEKDMLSVILLMAENVTVVHHVWLGGDYGKNDKQKNSWRWSTKRDEIPDYMYAKPFLNLLVEVPVGRMCLNLDREDHNKMMLYGLPCNFTQYFVCENNFSDVLPSNITDFTPRPKVNRKPPNVTDFDELRDGSVSSGKLEESTTQKFDSAQPDPPQPGTDDDDGDDDDDDDSTRKKLARSKKIASKKLPAKPEKKPSKPTPSMRSPSGGFTHRKANLSNLVVAPTKIATRKINAGKVSQPEDGSRSGKESKGTDNTAAGDDTTPSDTNEGNEETGSSKENAPANDEGDNNTENTPPPEREDSSGSPPPNEGDEAGKSPPGDGQDEETPPPEEGGGEDQNATENKEEQEKEAAENEETPTENLEPASNEADKEPSSPAKREISIDNEIVPDEDPVNEEADTTEAVLDEAIAVPVDESELNEEEAPAPVEETSDEPEESAKEEENLLEEALAEDVSAEEVPTEEAPAEEAPAEEMPAEEAATEEAPNEETPAEEVASESPVEEIIAAEESAKDQETITEDSVGDVEERAESVAETEIKALHVDELAMENRSMHNSPVPNDEENDIVLSPTPSDVDAAVTDDENTKDTAGDESVGENEVDKGVQTDPVRIEISSVDEKDLAPEESEDVDKKATVE